VERETIAAGGLTLRPFQEDDIPWVYEVSLDPMMQKYLQIPVPYRLLDAEFFVREVCIGGWDRELRTEFVVGRDGVRLGRVGLWFVGNATAQIGYWMDPAVRSRGIATAAVRAVCRWGFERLGLELIEWRAEVGNEASRRVAEKSGFLIEATLRRRLVHRGVRVDAWIGSLLPSE
jgi:RimJ/RimL family protein N-acetyltransferase